MLGRIRLDWRTVTMGVLGALISLLVWQANNSLGRLEATELDIQDAKVHIAVLNEAILAFRADQKETLERVKRIEQIELSRGK